MNTIVDDLNNSLKILLEDLLNQKNQTESALSSVNEKITEKVDEAKQYKIEVDNAKEQINILEDEISSLESDLSEINEKFGKKNLKGIVEAGNIEINSKIAEKQQEITKHRHKITELTEKARSIKDLLINLKKDKIFKEEKLENYTNAYNYYNESLTKIINYSENNSDNLVVRETNYDYLKTKYIDDVPVTSTGVFDEIESIDNDINNKNQKNEEEVEKEDNDEFDDNNEFLEKLKKASFELEDLEETIDLEYNNIFSDNLENNKNINDNNIEEEKDIIKEDKITEETEVIEEIKEDDNFTVHPDIFNQDVTESVIENTNIPDIFGNNIVTEEILNQEISEEPVEEKPNIEEFFKNYAIDFNRFDNNMQNDLLNTFTPEMFKKTINVLTNNNIDLNNLYNAGNIFIETSPIELEKIISKLLLAGQTTTNIGFVLNTLPSINSTDLTDAISSFGEDIKNINITDLIIKTQNISEIGKSE